MQRLAILVVLAVVVPAAAFAQEPAPKTATTPASKRDRERRAESAFVAGRYQEAAQLLDGLYVEFHNPVYLRNLGRCYQRLKDPERAIAAFEEYLSKGKAVTASERDEVNGFIRDMQELKRQQQAAATPPPPPPPPAPTPVPAPVVTAAVPAPAVAPAPMQAVESRPASSSHGSGKLVGGILLGAGALLAAGGGYMLASSWSEYRRGQHIGCPGLFDCKAIADRVESRALVGKILFGAAAAAGIAGGTVLVLSYSHGSETAGTGLTVAVRGRF
jgi:hypothetical protein